MSRPIIEREYNADTDRLANKESGKFKSQSEYMEKDFGGFGYDFRYWLIDNITDQQWAIVGYYLLRGDEAEAGRYLRELSIEGIKKLIRDKVAQ